MSYPILHIVLSEIGCAIYNIYNESKEGSLRSQHEELKKIGYIN